MIVGFGPYAEAAVNVLLRRGWLGCSIRVIPTSREEAARAWGYGLLVEEVESTDLTQPPLPGHIIVDLANCADALKAVRQVGGTSPSAEIVVAIRQPAHRAEFLAAGASVIVCPASLAGQLLARSLTVSEKGRASTR